MNRAMRRNMIRHTLPRDMRLKYFGKGLPHRMAPRQTVRWMQRMAEALTPPKQRWYRRLWSRIRRLIRL